MGVINGKGWVQPGEEVRLALVVPLRCVGSRLGDQLRVPHPPPADAPDIVDTKVDCPEPAEFTVAGGFPGFDWVEDDSVGAWVEAADPHQDAVRAADFLAAGRGQVGIVVTNRRVAVVFPEHLLADVRAAAREKKGLLGRAMDGLLGSDHFGMAEPLVSLWETDARRLRGWSEAMVGRGFPFVRLVRFDFADGSVLFARKQLVKVVTSF